MKFSTYGQTRNLASLFHARLVLHASQTRRGGGVALTGCFLLFRVTHTHTSISHCCILTRTSHANMKYIKSDENEDTWAIVCSSIPYLPLCLTIFFCISRHIRPMNKQFVIHYMHILFEKICHGFLAENLKYFVFIILHIYVCVCVMMWKIECAVVLVMKQYVCNIYIYTG